MTKYWKTKTYSSYWSMRTRCYNPNVSERKKKSYQDKGIKVCERWLESFHNFLEDMGERPLGMTLDRIENDGDYTKDNCKWSTAKEQAANRDNSVKVKGIYHRPETARRRQSWYVNGDGKYLGRFSEYWDAICCRKSWEVLN